MRAIRTGLVCLAIAALSFLSFRLAVRGSPPLKPPPAPGYQSPAGAVAGYTGNMMHHRVQAACRYSLPGSQSICAMGVGAMFMLGNKITGTWTLGHAVTDGDKAIVDVEYQACLGTDCLTNTDPDAGLPASGTSFSAAFRQDLANFNYATDCLRLHGRWYVDVITGPSSDSSPQPGLAK